jgi:hypothetical protein
MNRRFLPFSEFMVMVPYALLAQLVRAQVSYESVRSRLTLQS